MSIFSRKTSEIDRILDEATKLSQIGRNNEAITILNRAIEMEDTRGEAFLILGQLYDNLGQKEKAIITYKKGIKAHPNFVDNYFDLAVIYGQQIPMIRKNLMDYPIGYLAETIERAHEYFLKSAYLGDSESKNILTQQGIKATTQEEFISELVKIGNKRLERNNFEEAKSIFSFIVQKNSDDNTAIKVLSVCHFNIGQNLDKQMDYKTAYNSYSEAYSFAVQLYKKDSSNQEYKGLLGVILLTIGNLFGSINKHDKAIEHLEKSKSLIGNNYDLFKYLGQEYFFNEQVEQANKYLLEYSSLNNIDFGELLEETKLLQYHKYLGKVNLLAGNRGHNQNEFDFIKKAIQLYPNKQDAYFYLGICYKDIGDNQKSLEAFRKALEVEPKGQFTSIINEEIKSKESTMNNSQGYIDYYESGYKKFRNGNLDEALQEQNKSIELNTTFYKSYHERAVIKTNLKDFNGAIKDFETAIKLNPNDAELYFGLGYAFLQSGDKITSKMNFTIAAEMGHASAMHCIHYYFKDDVG